MQRHVLVGASCRTQYRGICSLSVSLQDASALPWPRSLSRQGSRSFTRAHTGTSQPSVRGLAQRSQDSSCEFCASYVLSLVVYYGADVDILIVPPSLVIVREGITRGFDGAQHLVRRCVNAYKKLPPSMT